MNSAAEELNRTLENSAAGSLLSELGRRLYFPKGIIAQSAEAKKQAYTANATIGMAFHHGKPIMLNALREELPHLSESEAVAYAPTAGLESLRLLWQKEMLLKNPSLKKENISLPVVVPGITAGITYIAELFLDKKDAIIVSTPCWDNYRLIFKTRREAKMRFVPFFYRTAASGGGADGSLNLDNIKNAISASATSGFVRIILNFPNNPAGYSPTESEAEEICEYLLQAAEGGAYVLVICDDAYFGLFYEDNIYKESLFARLSSLHRRILAVKADGPTKEDYVWGLRCAFLTFGSRGLDENVFQALVEKLKGAIRSSVSCSNTPAQSLLVKLYNNSGSIEEKKRFFEVLKRKYLAMKDFIRAKKNFKPLRPLPFNSGYFMSFLCEGFDAESLRLELLRKHGIGLVSIEGNYIRVAFSSIKEGEVPKVLETLYKTAAELSGA